MKIVISKSQWEEMGKKAGWMKTAALYSGTPCPKCGCAEHSILNPSHPIINECAKCKYQWNPDNIKTAQKVDIAEIIKSIKERRNEYFSYNHFSTSNMSDYSLMQSTIEDLVSLYGINEVDAGEIVQALTHNKTS